MLTNELMMEIDNIIRECLQADTEFQKIDARYQALLQSRKEI